MAVTINIPNSGSIGASDIWDVDLSGYAVAGSGGKLLTDNLNAPVGSVPTNPMLATEDGSSFSAIPDMATATKQADLETDTQDLQTQVGVAGLGLSAIPDMATETTLDKTYNHIGSDTIDTENYGTYPNGNANQTGGINFTGQPGDGHSITIDATSLTPAGESRTYTFRTGPSLAANEVLIGALALNTARNLFEAIVGDPAGSGTNYGAGTTAHQNVTALQDTAAITIDIYSIKGGTDGDNITISKSHVQPQVTSPLAGGSDLGQPVQITGGIADTFGSTWTTLIPPNVIDSIFDVEILIDALGGGGASYGALKFAYGHVGSETEFHKCVIPKRYYLAGATPLPIKPPLKEIPANSRISVKFAEDFGGDTIDLWAKFNKQ